MQLLVAKKSRSEDVEEKLSTDNFEELMLRSFPPCMRRMVERQRETKRHLKHAGRLQLRGFLKECGFTIEDSYKWWRTELCACQNIDTTKFEKDYSYDLEHTYGKKGHLQGLGSFGCPKIIGFPAESVGQVHGCPFKNLEMTALKQQLHRWKVPEKEVFEMEKLINQLLSHDEISVLVGHVEALSDGPLRPVELPHLVAFGWLSRDGLGLFWVVMHPLVSDVA